MPAKKLIRESSRLLFPDDKAVSVSEYRNNITRAEQSGDMTFSMFKNRMNLWETTL